MKLKLIILSSIISISISSFVFSQNLENSKWHFGQGVAINFNTPSNDPVLLGFSNMDTYENCSSVSDANGTLLFYSNGERIWNRQHSTMVNGNGIFGHSSNTQGLVIIPVPGSEGNYYLFNLDGTTGGRNGLTYNMINMNLNGGIGQVVEKNRPLKTAQQLGFPVHSEKITSTLHSSGESVWLVTQIGDRIYTYLVTDEGIMEQNTGGQLTNINIDGSNGVGQMKISPDGNRLAIIYAGVGNSPISGIHVYEFNNTTGQIGNLLQIPIPIFDGSDNGSPYGVEFSPNSEYVYFTTRFDGTFQDKTIYNRQRTKIKSNLYQADLTKSRPPTVLIAPNLTASALQLAINDKIYVNNQINGVAVINSPNNFGTAVNYVDDIFNLPTYAARIGLPQWVHLPNINDCEMQCETAGSWPITETSALPNSFSNPSVVIDTEGNIYTSHIDASSNSYVTIRKYDALGNLVFTQPYSQVIKELKVDDYNNLYVFFENKIEKYNSDHELLWSINIFGGVIKEFDVDKFNEDLYYTSQSSNNQVYKISSSGTQSILISESNNSIITNIHFSGGILNLFQKESDTQYLASQYNSNGALISNTQLVTPILNQIEFFYSSHNNTFIGVELAHGSNINFRVYDADTGGQNSVLTTRYKPVSPRKLFFDDCNDALLMYYDVLNHGAMVIKFENPTITSKLIYPRYEFEHDLYNRSYKSIATNGGCVFINSSYGPDGSEPINTPLNLADGVSLPTTGSDTYHYLLKLDQGLSLTGRNSNQSRIESSNIYFSVSPNPAKTKITLKSTKKIKRVEIYNILGENKLVINKQNSIINITNLREGLYFVKAYYIDGTFQTRRLLKN